MRAFFLSGHEAGWQQGRAPGTDRPARQAAPEDPQIQVAHPGELELGSLPTNNK